MKCGYREQLLRTSVKHGSWSHRAQLLSAFIGLGLELSLYTLWSAIKVHPQPCCTELRHQLMWSRSTHTEGHRGHKVATGSIYPKALVVLLMTATGISWRWLKCIPSRRQKRKMQQTQNRAWEQRLRLTSYFSEQLFSASHREHRERAQYIQRVLAVEN